MTGTHQANTAAQNAELDVAALIDHTVLAPTATVDDIDRCCAEAIEHGFASVCINPVWVPHVAAALAGTPIKTCTVVGFPLGAQPAELKAAETTWCVAHGAQEVDMVINIAAAIAGQRELLEQEIRSVVRAAGDEVVVKVIVECCLLSPEQQVLACQAAEAAGADFVKTSTGFSTSGATVADVARLRATVGEDMGVKASGGIRNRQSALAMIDAGATRIGASASVAICAGE